MYKIKWYVTAPSGKKKEISIIFNKIIFKENQIHLECDGFKTTRDYPFLSEHNAIIE